ncbi:uncharacterized protein LOC124291155 isoform X2 [Haliotis rubra]|uniref:uncharacterized protein LOC124291155 isoform X2 n=1 Tax=Haliotis rubra TaxID=36100 RepID=UPI001EE5264F|nr:uncharacterized protein LOC124291155 isoform X2 [Haliotis rubra]
MASGQQHLQNEATEPSETRQDGTQRFQNQLASLPANTEVVTSLSSFYNVHNFIAIHAVCGNPDDDDDDDDDFNSDPNYGFSDLASQEHGSYNSGPSSDIRLNDNLDLSQLDAGDGVMGCMGVGRGCTGAELCTSGRYNQGPSSLPEGAEYCMTGEANEQTGLKTAAPSRLAEEHREAQQHPAPNCGEYFPLQTNSSGYITEAISAANLRDQQNRFRPILEAFLESLQTNRKNNQQTTGQQVEDVDEIPSTVATADQSPAPPRSHTPASALAVVVAAGSNRDEEDDEVAGCDGELRDDDEFALSDEELTEAMK